MHAQLPLHKGVKGGGGGEGGGGGGAHEIDPSCQAFQLAPTLRGGTHKELR